MLYLTAYDTKMGALLNTNVEAAIKAALITSNLGTVSMGIASLGELRACFITGRGSDEMSIPPLIHPYLLKNHKGVDYLVADVRLFKSNISDYDSDTKFEENVRNKGEYNFVKRRVVMTLLWLTRQQDKLLSRLQFAGTVYAAWLCNSISRYAVLDLADQAKLTALTLYFYHTLFIEGGKLEGERLQTAVIHTIKTTKLPAKDVYSLFESLEEMNSISDYCAAIPKVLDNIRLKDFNLAGLLSLIRNSWFGTNGKELIGAALEHPPTWVSIVFATMQERSYRNSPLFKVIESASKMNRGGADEFAKNFVLLTSDVVMSVESIYDNIVHSAESMDGVEVEPFVELTDFISVLDGTLVESESVVSSDIPAQEVDGMVLPAFKDEV